MRLERVRVPLGPNLLRLFRCKRHIVVVSFSFFNSIGHFFSSLFGPNGSKVQQVLHDVSSFTNLALPVVEAVETELKAFAPIPGVTQIEAFLVKHVPQLANIGTVAQNLSTLSGTALFQGVAAAVLGAIVPGGTELSVINLAIELAYSTFKAIQAAVHPAASSPAPAAPAPAAA